MTLIRYTVTISYQWFVPDTKAMKLYGKFFQWLVYNQTWSASQAIKVIISCSELQTLLDITCLSLIYLCRHRGNQKRGVVYQFWTFCCQSQNEFNNMQVSKATDSFVLICGDWWQGSLNQYKAAQERKYLWGRELVMKISQFLTIYKSTSWSKWQKKKEGYDLIFWFVLGFWFERFAMIT